MKTSGTAPETFDLCQQAYTPNTGWDGLGGDGLGTKKSAARSARRPKRSRAQLREMWGGTAYRVVRAYCDRRPEVGLASVDAKTTGVLAGQCMRLLDNGSWDEATLRDAAVKYADTARFPGYFHEWCSQLITERELATHADEKKAQASSESVRPDRGLRSIASILGSAA